VVGEDHVSLYTCYIILPCSKYVFERFVSIFHYSLSSFLGITAIGIHFQSVVRDPLNHGLLYEKKVETDSSGASVDHGYTGDVEDPINYDESDFEVFKKTTTGVDFRTVGWRRASIIFLKGAFPQYSINGLF
jgi:hypothetical protein